MNIPDKAVEAAVKALFEDGCGEPKIDAATALEAAAPFIAAQALRDLANSLEHDTLVDYWQIHEAADELGPQ